MAFTARKNRGKKKEKRMFLNQVEKAKKFSLSGTHMKNVVLRKKDAMKWLRVGWNEVE